MTPMISADSTRRQDIRRKNRQEMRNQRVVSTRECAISGLRHISPAPETNIFAPKNSFSASKNDFFTPKYEKTMRSSGTFGDRMAHLAVPGESNEVSMSKRGPASARWPPEVSSTSFDMCIVGLVNSESCERTSLMTLKKMPPAASVPLDRSCSCSLRSIRLENVNVKGRISSGFSSCW